MNKHIHTLTHSHTYSLVCTFTHSQIHSLIHSFNYSFTHSPTLPLTLTHSLIHSHTHSLSHSLTHSLTLTHSFTHSLTLTHSLSCNSRYNIQQVKTMIKDYIECFATFPVYIGLVSPAHSPHAPPTLIISNIYYIGFISSQHISLSNTHIYFVCRMVTLDNQLTEAVKGKKTPVETTLRVDIVVKAIIEVCSLQ